jgi:hypothetical protein
MDTQVLAVDQKMAQITSSIQHISDNLTPKRNRIEHLSGIHTLVNKVWRTLYFGSHLCCTVAQLYH